MRPPENENGSADVSASADPNTFGPLSETSGSLDSTPSPPGARILEIACPGDSSAPLHYADFWPEGEVLSCARCGVLSSAEICARVEAEWSDIDVHPPLAEDERRVETMAAKLLALLPREAPLAVELAVAWGHWSLRGRLPEDHLAACAERALDRIAA